jgi:hypothetical protein
MVYHPGTMVCHPGMMICHPGMMVCHPERSEGSIKVYMILRHAQNDKIVNVTPCFRRDDTWHLKLTLLHERYAFSVRAL